MAMQAWYYFHKHFSKLGINSHLSVWKLQRETNTTLMDWHTSENLIVDIQ